MFHVFRIQNFVTGEGVESTGCRNDDMRALVLVAKNFSIFSDGCATIEGADADIGHILGEAGVFVFYLKGKFPGMAKDDHRNFAIDRLQLLKRREDEDCGLSMARFGLT